MTKEEFEKIFKVKLKEKDGGLFCKYSISVPSIIKTLPDNLTIEGSLYINSKNFTKLPKNLTIYGSLYIESTNIKKLPYDLVVYNDICAANSKVTTIANNFKVGGGINLSNTPIEKIPLNLVVTSFLNLSNTKIKKIPKDLIVGGYLNILNTEITTLPDDFIVGGLIISNDNFIFPRNLSARSLTLFTFPKYLPIDLKVGIIIYKEYFSIKVNKAPSIFNWGKYISINSLELYEVVSFKNNIYKVKTLYRNIYYYVASNKEGFSIKHKSLRKVKKYLPYSGIRDINDYRELSLNKKLSLTESVICYRTITRACLTGVMDFIESKNLKETDSFTVLEISKLARKEYHTKLFNTFFNLK